MNEKMTKKQSIAIRAASIYIVIMAIGMAVMNNGFGIKYSSPNMTKIIFFVEIVLTAFTVYVYLKHFKGSAFNKVKINGFIIEMLIAVFIIALLQIFTGDYKNKDIVLILYIVFTTLLVGISEELMFRGIVLTAFINREKHYAIVVSSAMFSILHFVNILGGLPTKDMLNQMMLTYLVGIVFAFVFIKTNNLLLLMIYHSFWDMLLIVSSYVPSSLAALAMLAQNIVILTFALYIMVDHLYKKSKKAK